jgi:hypothetical protein
MAGSTGKSLVQKLGIQPGFCIFTAGAPAPCGDIIGQLPAPVTVVTRLRTMLDMVHVLEAAAPGSGSKFMIPGDQRIKRPNASLRS